MEKTYKYPKGELETVAVIKPALDAIIDDWHLPEKALTASPSKKDVKMLSVKLYESVLCKIKMNGKKRYISIPTDYKKYIPENIIQTKTKSEPEFTRLQLNTPQDAKQLIDMLCKILDDMIFSIPKEFSCCSRYVECSDALKCIHPDREFAKGCYYKKNLKQGKVFYGKNKNF